MSLYKIFIIDLQQCWINNILSKINYLKHFVFLSYYFSVKILTFGIIFAELIQSYINILITHKFYKLT